MATIHNDLIRLHLVNEDRHEHEGGRKTLHLGQDSSRMNVESGQH